MYLLHLIVLLSSNALSSPTPPLNLTLCTDNPSGQTISPSDNPPDPRNPYSIAATCILTTFLCAWTSVHPNVAPTGISWWTRKKLRVELLFWTIVAPELVLSWAMCQWMGARRLARKHKADGWTMAHGFFLMMGGFCYIRGQTRHILHYDHARGSGGNIVVSDNCTTFRNMEPAQIRRITEIVSSEEIKDKSKSDFLSKSITTLQTTWFIVQCIARRVQGLSITELELTTIAIAMLNSVMVFFWWHKPMDVEVPILLHGDWNSSQPSTDETLGNKGLGIEGEEIREKPGNARYERNAGGKWVFLTGPLSTAAQMIVADLDAVPRSENRFTVIRKTNKMERLRLVFLAVVASVFGGFHLVAWKFTFPSQGAWVCWQTSALVLVIGIWAIAFIPFVVGFREVDPATIAYTWLSASVAISFLYVAARLTLLIEALVLLAHIPPDGLKQVDWLRFIPHL